MRSQGLKKMMLGVTIVAAMAAGVMGCTSARPTGTPGVDEVGEYVLTYGGPELEMVLGFRHAASELGDEWLILDTNFTAAHGGVTKVDRSKVFVRTPAGDRIPMATQEEFAEAFGGLRATLRKADVNSDPLDYFPPDRDDCEAGFFTVPGAGIAYDELTLNDRRVCKGRLFFKVPGGVQAGRWTFGIDLEETRVRMPFKL
jgi:hypothetical protein